MMDSPAGDAPKDSKRTGDTPPSTSKSAGQRGDGPKPKKAAVKRKAAGLKNAKTKKRKVATRSARPRYTVHEGEDMLLVLSGPADQYEGSVWKPPKKRGKKKLAKGKLKAQQIKKKRTVRSNRQQTLKPDAKTEVEPPGVGVRDTSAGNRWGQSLPEELLVKIFRMVVVQDGAVPFLCRVGRVCRLWNTAASTPVLWRKVTISHCWIDPGKKQLPKTEKRIRETFDWLTQNRFSQLQEFSLFHWTSNVNYAVQVVAKLCPHLRSLTLSYCSGLTESALQTLGLHSHSLQSLNFQFSEFQVDGLVEYLENHGSQIKQIWFTHGLKTDKYLSTITRGSCPNLEFFELNTKLDSKDCEVSLCIKAFQAACPKLKTFRMLNIRLLPKTMRSAADSSCGFPLLEELCIANTSYSSMTDRVLLDILFSSTKLRVLDLRGCTKITPTGLESLPCPELECLFWGQYFSSHIGLSTPKRGLHLLTQKWSQTLQQLDITNQLFSEDDLELAMSNLAQATEADTLRSLNLTGTRITTAALRLVIGHSTALNYLNLASCRYLPRGVKRIYRGRDDIRQLLD